MAIIAFGRTAIIAFGRTAIVAFGRTAIVASPSRLFRASLSCEYISNSSIACSCDGVKSYSFAGHYIESGDFYSYQDPPPKEGIQ